MVENNICNFIAGSRQIVKLSLTGKVHKLFMKNCHVELKIRWHNNLSKSRHCCVQLLRVNIPDSCCRGGRVASALYSLRNINGKGVFKAVKEFY